MSAAEDQTIDLNMELWNSVRTPNPAHTKGFKRGGGFSGTAISGQYVAQMLTEQFGPCGYGWKIIITGEEYRTGQAYHLTDGTLLGNAIVHVVRGHLTYKVEDEWYETSDQFGQTTFVGKNKNGLFTDEEAPKKSATDLMSKCASLIGVAADIHLGKWDDNKYVNQVKEDYAAKSSEAKLVDDFIALVEITKTREALEEIMILASPSGATWQQVLQSMGTTHRAQSQRAKQKYMEKLQSFGSIEGDTTSSNPSAVE
jgi:hypothetical protein